MRSHLLNQQSWNGRLFAAGASIFMIQYSSWEQFKTEEKDNFPNVDPMFVDCSFLKMSQKSTISHNFLDFSNESELARRLALSWIHVLRGGSLVSIPGVFQDTFKHWTSESGGRFSGASFMSLHYISERIQKGRATEITQHALLPHEETTSRLFVYIAAFQFHFIMKTCFAGTQKGHFCREYDFSS